MADPKVTFVVPCYELAHFLPQCINSILMQSYEDFEILIMDDCSPDNTEEVSRSFQDPRIKYIRNEVNLKHIINFNKGVAMARGKYVWLISADDYIRSKDILKRYLELLESNPKVGYVFSTGYGVRDGKETRLYGRYRGIADRDQVIPGHTLFKTLIHSNFILTPSGLVRKECYDKISYFQESMPWVGDWYLWNLFALHYDAGYFAEPMLCYREAHEFSMTYQLTKKKADVCAVEEIMVAWSLMKKAMEAGHSHLKKACLSGIASTYARTLSANRYKESNWYMNLDRFEESLQSYTTVESERNWIRARVYDRMANECYWRKENDEAKRLYGKAVAKDPSMVGSHVKRALLAMGKPGDAIRRGILSIG